MLILHLITAHTTELLHNYHTIFHCAVEFRVELCNGPWEEAVAEFSNASVKGYAMTAG